MTQNQHVTDHQGPRDKLLSEIRSRVSLPPNVTAEQALQAVVCAFDQHISGGESRHLFDSLPGDVRPIVGSCLLHRDEPAARFGLDGLIERVADHLKISREDAHKITLAVIAAVSEQLPEREVEHVATQLPEPLKVLWLAPWRPADMRPVLDDIATSPELPVGITASVATRVVLCELTRRLECGEARHFVDSLPSSVGHLVEPCVRKRDDHPEVFDREQYLARVAHKLRTSNVEPIVLTVFRAVQRHLPKDVIRHVSSHLPRDLQDLWMPHH